MSLCRVCSAVPLERLFGSERGPREYEIGELKHVRANRLTCTLCTFWAEAYELAYLLPPGRKASNHRSLRLELQIGAPLDDAAKETEEPWFERAGIWAWAETAETGPCLWLNFRPAKSENHVSQSPLVCISCIPRKEDLKVTAKLMPRIRNQEEISNCRLNYTNIRQWINHCSSKHIDKCQQSMSFKRQTLRLRLVNVKTRRIEYVYDERPYLALSYVWGPLHKEYGLHFWQSCAAEGGTISLPKVLPRTIEDALTLTEKIGFSYIWVDAFCINQSDNNEVQEQLVNMHVVFECAFLVIAAMDGAHADAGICGVSRDLPRKTQPRTRTAYGDFIATYVTDIWQEQGKSAWEQRAWTLQELLLAKRILLLHSKYIDMRCPQGVYCDLLEINDDYHAAKFQQCETHFWENGFDVDLNKPVWDFGNFDAFLANYTRRKLTKSEDILNACLGALSQITQNTGVGFIQGMPRADIHLALLWKPYHEEMLNRRTGFPSWTWAGWEGRIEHHYCIDDLAGYETQGPVERQHYVDNGGSIASQSAVEYIVANSEAYIPTTGEESALLHLSSQVASVTAFLVRRRREKVRGLARDSEQPRIAVGDHWVILDIKGRPLANHVGEVARFEATDYSFQTNPAISVKLRQRDCRCDLVYIKYFPYLRDTSRLMKDSWLFDQVGCLVVMKDEDQELGATTATRIGMVFLGLQDWLDLSPQNEMVTLI